MKCVHEWWNFWGRQKTLKMSQKSQFFVLQSPDTEIQPKNRQAQVEEYSGDQRLIGWRVSSVWGAKGRTQACSNNPIVLHSRYVQILHWASIWEVYSSLHTDRKLCATWRSEVGPSDCLVNLLQEIQVKYCVIWKLQNYGLREDWNLSSSVVYTILLGHEIFLQFVVRAIWLHSHQEVCLGSQRLRGTCKA